MRAPLRTVQDGVRTTPAWTGTIFMVSSVLAPLLRLARKASSINQQH